MVHLITHIFADMDGTLLNEDKKLPGQMFALLDELKRRGISFGIASGRQIYNLYERFPSYAEDMLFIAENGAAMFEGKNCIFYNEIPYEDLMQLVQRIRQLKDAWVVLCGVNSAYVENDQVEFIKNTRMYYQRLQMSDDVLEAAKQDHICKIAIYDAQDTQTNGCVWMQDYVDGKHMVISGKHWIDITNPNVNKGSAIAFLKKYKHMDGSQIMAFGDYMNDYEMLMECEESYAMANAHPQILNIAKHRAKSNEENGVVDAICQYFQIHL